jgi:hypothetical protein
MRLYRSLAVNTYSDQSFRAQAQRQPKPQHATAAATKSLLWEILNKLARPSHVWLHHPPLCADDLKLSEAAKAIDSSQTKRSGANTPHRRWMRKMRQMLPAGCNRAGLHKGRIRRFVTAPTS